MSKVGSLHLISILLALDARELVTKVTRFLGATCESNGGVVRHDFVGQLA
jgi:hypothetical protein